MAYQAPRPTAMDPPVFPEDLANLEDFLLRYEAAATYNRWNPAAKTANLVRSLRDHSLLPWFLELDPAVRNNWDLLVAALRAKRPSTYVMEQQALLFTRRQGTVLQAGGRLIGWEPIAEFAAALRRIARNTGAVHSEAELRKILLNGLAPHLLVMGHGYEWDDADTMDQVVARLEPHERRLGQAVPAEAHIHLLLPVPDAKYYQRAAAPANLMAAAGEAKKAQGGSFSCRFQDTTPMPDAEALRHLLGGAASRGAHGPQAAPAMDNDKAIEQQVSWSLATMGGGTEPTRDVLQRMESMMSAGFKRLSEELTKGATNVKGLEYDTHGVPVVCQLCDGIGHTSKRCPETTGQPLLKKQTIPGVPRSYPMCQECHRHHPGQCWGRCGTCGKFGHQERNCRSRGQAGGAAGGNGRNGKGVYGPADSN